MSSDYAPNDALDKYDETMLDDAEYEPLTYEQRREAELLMKGGNANKKKSKKRNKETTISTRVPIALQFEEQDSSDEDDIGIKNNNRNRYYTDGQLKIRDDEEEEIESEITNIEEVKGPLREWIVRDGPRREIAKRFRNFLASQIDSQTKRPIYQTRIQTMCLSNKQSLEVSYLHLSKLHPTLAIWLAEAPCEMLKIFEEVTTKVVMEMFSEYHKIHKEIKVRITELPVNDTLRSLRQLHLNCFVKVTGVVTRRTSVFPQLLYVKYNCNKCNSIIGPFTFETNTIESRLGTCPQCQSKSGFTVNSELTIYRNYQRITLQESPGTVPAGRLPRTKEVIVINDLIDTARPGEEIQVTGIYRNNFEASLNTQHGFPVFGTIIEANYIAKKEDLFAAFKLTEEDEKQIRELSKQERIGEKLIRSIAPSIFGHEDIKTAIALALFGGECKEDNKDKHRIRGDINVLLLGDPGTAKSQFLKYVEKTSHRSVYATGQGASAVGLTASVRKDPVTREWTLEGGALVLADNGICLIDEFDKMNDKDRTSIHEAMEQQSISISKAGIVTTLQARCSVIAAANPIRGRYDSSLPFSRNVELGDPILSRFDILCVVRDVVNPLADEQLAKFVVTSHRKSHPDYATHVQIEEEEEGTKNDQTDTISQDLLRKYIMYAKQKIHPRIPRMDMEKITNLYAELRRESKISGGLVLTVRSIESIIRMSEAHAKMHLREEVKEEDVNMAIRVALDSFITSQKYSIARNLRKKFYKYVTYKRDYNQLLFYLLQTLVRETVNYYQLRHGVDPDQVEISVEDFETRAREMDINDFHNFYKCSLFKNNNFVVDKKKRVIKKEYND